MPLPVAPTGTGGVIVLKVGKSIDDMVAALDDNKVQFGLIKTSGKAENSSTFARKSTCLLTYKGPNVGQVKAAKVMAHVNAVSAFCHECIKITTKVSCHDKDEVKSQITDAIKACTIDDSKDLGDVDFHLGDTKPSEKELLACPKFQVDMKNTGGYGLCICGHTRGEHSDAALQAALEDEPEALAPGRASLTGGTGYVSGQETLRKQQAEKAAKAKEERLSEKAEEKARLDADAVSTTEEEAEEMEAAPNWSVAVVIRQIGLSDDEGWVLFELK